MTLLTSTSDERRNADKDGVTRGVRGHRNNLQAPKCFDLIGRTGLAPGRIRP